MRLKKKSFPLYPSFSICPPPFPTATLKKQIPACVFFDPLQPTSTTIYVCFIIIHIYRRWNPNLMVILSLYITMMAQFINLVLQDETGIGAINILDIHVVSGDRNPLIFGSLDDFGSSLEGKRSRGLSKLKYWEPNDDNIWSFMQRGIKHSWSDNLLSSLFAVVIFFYLFTKFMSRETVRVVSHIYIVHGSWWGLYIALVTFLFLIIILYFISRYWFWDIMDLHLLFWRLLFYSKKFPISGKKNGRRDYNLFWCSNPFFV